MITLQQVTQSERIMKNKRTVSSAKTWKRGHVSLKDSAVHPHGHNETSTKSLTRHETKIYHCHLRFEQDKSKLGDPDISPQCITIWKFWTQTKDFDCHIIKRSISLGTQQEERREPGQDFSSNSRMLFPTQHGAWKQNIRGVCCLQNPEVAN